MSELIYVEIAGRKTRRDAEKILSKDLNKYIAEILSNSDDSYKRLEKKNILSDNDISPIYIEIDKYKKQVTIVDCAEGMDHEDMDKNFRTYGADTSGGGEIKNVRGLFGQGASDVLFNSSLHGKEAIIYSIKNDQLYTCDFLWLEDKKAIEISTSEEKNKDLISKLNIFSKTKRDQNSKSSQNTLNLQIFREKYKIPHNGTIVKFGLPDGVLIPNDLEKSIETFYMFRFIFNNPKRNIVLKVINEKSSRIHNLKYEFPTIADKDKLIEQKIEFSFDDKSVDGELLLFYMDPMEKINYGDLKVLVFDDENNIYDNTFFKFGSSYPGADKLSGLLKLNGTSKIIREYLNSYHAEEILTDTRDGLSDKHNFYKKLTETINPLIQKALDDINSTQSNKSINLDTNKEWNDAFKEINKYFKEELEENIGGPNTGLDAPTEGLRFARPQISISAGKTYGVQLLVNTSVIPIGSVIELSYGNEPNIVLGTNNFNVTENDVVHGNLAIKSLSIIGVESTENAIEIVAKCGSTQAKIFVNVINKEIHYPKYGLEFWPNLIITKVGNKSRLHLYFDTNKYPIGSIVKIVHDQTLLSTMNSYQLEESYLINNEIGVLICEFSGGKLNEDYRVSAICDGYETIGKIEMRDFETPPAGSSGFFSGAELKEEDQFWQTFYHPKTGKIIINKGNSINFSQLGDMSAVSDTNPKFNKDQKKYIADICAFECSKQITKKLHEKGKIDGNNYEKYLDELQKQKNRIYGIFENSELF